MDGVGMHDHDGVPVEGAIKIHPDICYSLLEPDGYYDTDLKRIVVWHWCTKSKWHENAQKVNYEGWAREAMVPTWRGAGVGAHTLHNMSPLHLEPSLAWSDCCEMHGHIRDGKWESV
jgi:hypothetical protein